MTKFYRDFYGSTASIKVQRDGTALLRVYAYGQRVHSKTYSTERGARIALGRISDCWREVKRA